MTSAKIHWCSLYSHYCAFSLCLASYLLCLIICRHAWNDLCYAYKHILLVICFVNNCRPLVHVSRVVPKLSAVLACLKCSLKSHKCKSFQPIIIVLHTYTCLDHFGTVLYNSHLIIRAIVHKFEGLPMGNKNHIVIHPLFRLVSVNPLLSLVTLKFEHFVVLSSSRHSTVHVYSTVCKWSPMGQKLVAVVERCLF